MEVLKVLIGQVTVMFILMGIGYLAYRRGIITDNGTKELGKILLNIAIPVVVISNFCVEKTPEKTADLINSIIISVICMVISIGVSVLLFHKKDRVDEFSAAFSNAGFIGIPLVQATLGTGAVFYISMMIVLVNLLQWTYGVYTITDDPKYINLKAVGKNPIVLSVFLGMIIFFFNLPVPQIVRSVFSSVSGMNTPLAMIVSGVYLAQSDLKTVFAKKDVYLTSLVRLVIVPLAVLAVFSFIPLGSQQLKLAILLAAACPVGSNVAIFAQQYNKNYTKGIENVCVSTIISILSLPLVVYIATLLLK